MGNTHPHPLFNILTPWPEKSYLIDQLQLHNNSIGCKQSVRVNASKRLDIICSKQNTALRKYWNENKKAKAENKDPLPVPDVCKGRIVALPKVDRYSGKTFWYIRHAIDHTCIAQGGGTNMNPLNALCTANKCIPCESLDKKTLLTKSTLEKALLTTIPLWSLVTDFDSYKLCKKVITKNFQSAMNYINSIGEIAERESHHPDLHITSYRNVEIILYTHSEGGVTMTDIALAKMMDDEIKVGRTDTKIT